MSKINKHKQNKNPAEKRAYKQFLKDIFPDEDSTIAPTNPNLISTDMDFCGDIDASKDEEILGRPFFNRILKHIKEHIVGEAIGLIFLVIFTFGKWTINSIMDSKIELGKITTKIEYIEKEIDNSDLKGNDISSYYTELYEIKETISEQKIDLKDINERIDILERKIQKKKR